MKFSRKILPMLQIILIVFTLTSAKANAKQNVEFNNRNIANIAIVLLDLSNPYMKKLTQSLENLENENKDKVKFTFFDGKNNISLQNETLDLAIKNNYDLVVAYLADTRETPVSDFILKAKQSNMPLLLMSISSEVIKNVSQDYDRVAFLLMDPERAGTLEGQIISQLWNTNKNAIDKNGDNILQYVLIKGRSNEAISEERARFAISALNNSGIKTELLQTLYSDWTKEVAKNAMENLFLRYANKIEAIIANSDTMAIGAIEALQKYGYNLGNKSKYIPVVGIAGIPEAKELIDKGFMAGTVIQDTEELAEGIYAVGMNLINDTDPLKNTNLKMKNGQIMILENPKIYTKQLNNS